MLNELYELSRALDKSGIEREACAAGFEVGRSQDGIRIFLSSDNLIERPPESVSASQMKGIRKWSIGPGLSLPVYNLDSLYSVPQSDFDRLRKAWEKSQRDAVSFHEPHPKSAKLNWPAISKSRSRTKDFQSTLTIACEQIKRNTDQRFDDGGDAWQVLLRILEHQDVQELVERLGSHLCNWVRAAPCPKCMLKLLYCPDGKSTKTPVQFEPEGVFEAPVYSQKAQQWLTQVRNRYTAKPKSADDPATTRRRNRKKAGGVIAIWGNQVGCTDAYPQNVDSPIGPLSFFNRDVVKKPASTRYNTQYAVFPVGSNKRNELITDFKWLIAKEHKGKTWAVSSKFGRPNKITRKPPPFLLLTYLSESVGDTPEHLAEVFVGPPEEESDGAIVQFETLCEDLINALDGIPSLSETACIRVFALHKPDGYRSQIFASDSFTQSALNQLAESWQADCRAHLPIKLAQFKQGNEAKPQDVEPLVPFPYQAVECLNTIWEKCEEPKGAKCDYASDYSIADVFELLRRTGSNPNDAAYLGRMLDLAVRRALPLMGAVGQAMHQVRQRVFTAQGGNGCALKSHLQARRWPCLLTLLLTRLGYKVGTFMKEPAYLVGRFFAQLDRLHAYYAKHVSGKEDGLRQLLGNSLMTMALESPLRAFELAGQRMLPYQAWGRQFSRGRKSKDAVDTVSDEARAANGDRWEVYRVLEELGRIAEDLAGCGIPEANHTSLPNRAAHYAEAPTKSVLDLTDTLKAKDRAWMHSDSAAKAQMLLGYLASPEGKKGTPASKTEPAPTPPDFD